MKVLKETDYLLEHAFINQFQTDIENKEYEPISLFISLLLKSDKNKELIIGYLSDSGRENWIEGKTSVRY